MATEVGRTNKPRQRRPLGGFAAVSILVLASVALGACKQETAQKERHYEKRFREQAPRVVIGKIYWGEGLGAAQRKEHVAAVHSVLKQIIEMVDRRDLSRLPDLVSVERGLWIDLKTHRKHAAVRKMLRRKGNYLQMFFLDSEALRRYTKEEQRMAVRDVLRYTGTLRADYYIESAKEMELKLFLEDYPDYNYHLNNPVFVREADGWKVFRLF